MLSSIPFDLPHAIQAFVHGFCFTRSFTHPYLAEKVGPLWVMRDAPRRRGRYRNEEWVAYDLAPDEIHSIVHQHKRGPYSISCIYGLEKNQDPIRTSFKTLGYRLVATESMMAHRLTQIPNFEAPVVIERVQTAEQAARLAHANRRREVAPGHFLPVSPLRQYMAIANDEVVGWVRSITVGKETWCADMFVNPAFRRRGIARALLSRMLNDDQAAGAQTAVLLASIAGARLYPVVGYEQIGTLLLFSPKK